MKTAIQFLLASIITFSISTTFARGVEVGGDVSQTAEADNIINVGIGKDVTAEQTLASLRGEVTVAGDVNQSVSADNFINVGIGAGVTARQTVSSIDSH